MKTGNAIVWFVSPAGNQKDYNCMKLRSISEQRILARFDELVEEGTVLVTKMVSHSRDWHSRHPNSWETSQVPGHNVEFNSFVVRSSNLVRALFDKSELSSEYTQAMKELEGYSWSVESIVGILRGLRDDFNEGFLDSLREYVIADISSDYMGQAEQLFKEGANANLGHVAAAATCGALFENSIRRLCDGQSPPIPTKKPNEDYKKLTAMIDELKKANVFNAMKRDQLQYWAKIRNSAAHGRFDEFERHDVDDMLRGVKNFLADYL